MANNKRMKKRVTEAIIPQPTHIEATLPVIKFELTYFPNNDKPWFATAYGDQLPRRGIAAYGYSPWDAISNAAIHAANHEYVELKRTMKQRPKK